MALLPSLLAQPKVTPQDAAIIDLVTNHRDALLASLWLNVAQPDENGCMEWTDHRSTSGSGAVKHAGLILQAHRIVYALHRGVDALPPGDGTKTGLNGPCVARICLNRLCVAPRHLARMRYQHIGYEPFYCNDEFLPDNYRFKAENIRRRGGKPVPHYYQLDRDPHMAALVGLGLTKMEDVRGRFSPAEGGSEAA